MNTVVTFSSSERIQRSSSIFLLPLETMLAPITFLACGGNCSAGCGGWDTFTGACFGTGFAGTDDDEFVDDSGNTGLFSLIH
jgi:hypothetical protein